MFANLVADGLDLISGALDGDGPGDFAGHPDGEEDGVEAAFFHARDVDAALRIARGEIEVAVEEALRGVGVGIDDDRGEMQIAGAGGEVVSLEAIIHGTRSEHECDGERTVGNNQADSASLTLHSSSGVLLDRCRSKLTLNPHPLKCAKGAAPQE